MKYILIFLATNGFMGEYDTLDSCKNAIRMQYEARLAPGAASNPAVQRAIDIDMQYQREYVCVPKGSKGGPK